MKLKSTFLCLLFLSGLLSYGQAPTITAEATPASFCPGDNITVGFTTSDTFAFDNVFNIELSDSVGSFDAPTLLDTLQSQSGDTLTIPAPAVAFGTLYRIRITASNPVAGDTTDSDLAFSALSKPLITVSGPTTFCASGSVTLSVPADPTLTYQWTKNGANLSGDTTESYVADSSGRYRVVVTDSFLCSATSDSIVITVKSNPVVTLNFSPDSFCIASPAFPLTGGLPAGGFYSDSNSYVSGNVFDPGLSGLGTYTVYYTYTDSFGCSSTAGKALRIVNCPVPSVTTTVTPSSFCPGTDMTVSFVTSDPFFFNNVFTIQLSDASGSFASPTVLDTVQSKTGDTLLIPVPLVTAGTNYKVRVVASSPSVNGVPSGSIAIRQQLAKPNVNLTAIGGTTSLCLGDSVMLKLDSLSALSTKWWRNDTAIASIGRFRALAKDSGLYVVRFTDTVVAGCASGYDTLLIAVHKKPAKPVITAGGPTEVCGDGAVTLSVPQNPTYTYAWTSFGNTIAGATIRIYTAEATGLYRAIMTNSFGCSSTSDSLQVTINPNPAVSFTLAFDSFCVNSPVIHLEGGSPVGGYYFHDSAFVSGSTFNPSASGIGLFTVYYTFADSIGCSDTATAELQIFDCTTSGVNDVSAENLFAMYPNPATDVVTFVTGQSTNYALRVLTLIGEEVASNIFTQQMTYSTKDLAAGTYLAEITDLSSGVKSVKRLIKQ